MYSSSVSPTISCPDFVSNIGVIDILFILEALSETKFKEKFPVCPSGIEVFTLTTSTKLPSLTVKLNPIKSPSPTSLFTTTPKVESSIL